VHFDNVWLYLWRGYGGETMRNLGTVIAIAALMIAAPAYAGMAQAASANYFCGHYKSVDDPHRVGVPAWAVQWTNAHGIFGFGNDAEIDADDPVWQHAICDRRLHKVIWCFPADEISAECKRYRP
jgi:hypothetical protein